MAIQKYVVKPIPARGIEAVVGEKGVVDVELFKEIAVVYRETETMRINPVSGFYSVTGYDGEGEREITRERRQKRMKNRKGGK